MRVTSAHLEVKTVRGCKKVWWKKAKVLRYKSEYAELFDLAGIIAIVILSAVVVGALMGYLIHH